MTWTLLRINLNVKSVRLVDFPVVVRAEGAQELERRGPGRWRIEDPEVRGLEDGIELSLLRQLDGGGPAQTRAAREVVRLAIAIFRGHRRKEPVLGRDVDEVDVGVGEDQIPRWRMRFPPLVERREQRRVAGSILAADGAVRRES